ncbi:bifunctional oligoribonuclease/PAP phosphatase NrnA [Virgibacillus oceani]
MKLKQIMDTIKAYETIIIHRHVRPDPDALGSQAGLKEIIKQTYPDKKVYAVGEEDPSFIFLTQMDEINDSIYEDALVIVCDTANMERISDDRYELGEKLIKIDHHPNVDVFGDIYYVDTEASSTSEIIYELYKQSELQMNEAAARLLYAGIVGDTGRFLFPSTTNKTFLYAAELVTYPFDRTALYNGLYRIKDNIARLRGYILQTYKLNPNGSCSVKLTQEILDEYGVTSLETGQLISVLGDVDDIIAPTFFIEEDGIIRVRLRSKGPVINEIAEKYNGGGHPLASGATVYSWEEAENLIRDIEEACREYRE